jgi:hypothetical protein
MGFAGEALETSEHLVFAGGVVGGPTGEVLSADGQTHLLRLDAAQQLGNAREGVGVVGKALPDLVPTALPLGEPFGGRKLTVFGGIELELLLPDGGSALQRSAAQRSWIAWGSAIHWSRSRMGSSASRASKSSASSRLPRSWSSCTVASSVRARLRATLVA